MKQMFRGLTLSVFSFVFAIFGSSLSVFAQEEEPITGTPVFTLHVVETLGSNSTTVNLTEKHDTVAALDSTGAISDACSLLCMSTSAAGSLSAGVTSETNDQWSLTFNPKAGTTLAEGTYSIQKLSSAMNAPYNMEVRHNGSACTNASGSFTISEIQTSVKEAIVISFVVSFSQSCFNNPTVKGTFTYYLMNPTTFRALAAQKTTLMTKRDTAKGYVQTARKQVRQITGNATLKTRIDAQLRNALRNLK
jgi:hypothetical protein